MIRRTIAVYVNSSKASDNRTVVASHIASEMNATLIGMSCEYISANAFANGHVSNRLLELEYERVSSVLESREKKFRELVGSKNIRLNWRQNNDYPLKSTIDQLRAVDLFIIGSDATIALEHRLNPPTVVMHAGRPVLYIPDQAVSASLKNVVIAWKDARESRRAIFDSIPYLQKAENILLLGVCEDLQSRSDVFDSISDVSQYLSSHNLICELKVIRGSKQPVGDEIISVANKFGADLIVAGAYGQSQVGEWIFGGVTETLLNNSPVACMFSH